MKQTITQKSYEQTAHAYAARVANFMQVNEIKEFISLLPQGGHILDLGCGSGRDAHFFTSKGFKVTGIDFSSNLIKIAQQNAPQAHFFTMNMEEISLANHQFDGIWASASLLHIPKKKLEPLLYKIKATLQENGIFYLSVKKGEGEETLVDDRYGGVEKFWVFYQENEILSVLERTGFQILKHMTALPTSDYQTHPFIRIFAKAS